MPHPSQIYTGTRYTATAAFLLLAVLAPLAAIWLSPASLEFIPILMGFTFSGMCIAGAWLQWKRHSESTILSIMSPVVRVK